MRHQYETGQISFEVYQTEARKELADGKPVVEGGGYFRVHVHPKRFPAATATDWRSRVLHVEDGFVVVEPRVQDSRIHFLQRREIPFVVHGRTGDRVDYPYFDIDNYAVAHRLTSHLTALGHRRIAFLNGMEGRSYCEARTRGYADALAEAGVRFDPALHQNGLMRQSFGLVETIRLMENPQTRPTAFIAGNSLLAKGIYDALEALSLSIPGDVSVVAHDDLLPAPETAAMHPPLTVTEAALQDSWEPMARLLVGALEGQPLETLQIIGDVRFVERHSTGPVATA